MALKGARRVPPVLMVGGMCWPFKSIDAAESCHYSGNCGGMTDYPFKNVDNNWGTAGEPPTGLSYLSRVWGAKNIPNSANVWGAVEAWTAANAGANINQLHPIHMAAVITDQHDSTDIQGVEGGRAFFGSAKWRAGGAVVFGEHFLGADPDTDGFKANALRVGIRLAHEFGHTLGLAHDDATVLVPDLGTYTSFMAADGDGTAPILSEAVPSLVQNLTQYQAWSTWSPGKDVPRPAGFAYRGCNDNASCPAGLSCVLHPDGGKICL